MSRWSGLAAAYDAHMALWEASSSDFKHLARSMDGTPIKIAPGKHKVFKSWMNFSRTWGLPQGGAVSPGMYESGAYAEESTVAGREQFIDTKHSLSTAFSLLGIEQEMLGRATTAYIADPIVRKLNEAAALAEPEPLFPTDLTDMAGFAVLESPILLPDFHPDTGELRSDIQMPIRAFGWCRHDHIEHGPTGDRKVGPGVMIMLYTTPDDYDAIYRPSLARLGVDTERTVGVQRDWLQVVDALPWAFGVSWASRDSAEHQDTTVPSSVAVMRRWFLTLMRFCWQTILVPGDDRLSKKVERRWEDLAKRKPLNEYTVLRLRRVVNPALDGAPRGQSECWTLNHQVKVRGHWRRQWFRSLGPAYDEKGIWNQASHRLVWIDEFWRGPEDAPIGAMHHASVVAR